MPKPFSPDDLFKPPHLAITARPKRRVVITPQPIGHVLSCGTSTKRRAAGPPRATLQLVWSDSGKPDAARRGESRRDRRQDRQLGRQESGACHSEGQVRWPAHRRAAVKGTSGRRNPCFDRACA